MMQIFRSSQGHKFTVVSYFCIAYYKNSFFLVVTLQFVCGDMQQDCWLTFLKDNRVMPYTSFFSQEKDQTLLTFCQNPQMQIDINKLEY